MLKIRFILKRIYYCNVILLIGYIYEISCRISRRHTRHYSIYYMRKPSQTNYKTFSDELKKGEQYRRIVVAKPSGINASSIDPIQLFNVLI